VSSAPSATGPSFPFATGAPRLRIETGEPGEATPAGLRYNFDRSLRRQRPIVGRCRRQESGGIVQGNQTSTESAQGKREKAAATAGGLRGPSSAKSRADAGTLWAGSAFDLAQGLEITVFETRMSIEDLDELFR
jgi:hypothetical protein